MEVLPDEYTVRLFLLDLDTNKMLTIQRAPDDFRGGEFELPGGGIKALYGETAKQAGVREGGKETGVELLEDDLEEVAIQGPRQTSQGLSKLTFWLKAFVENQDIQLNQAEHVAHRWIDRPDVPYLGDQPFVKPPHIWLPGVIDFGWAKAHNLSHIVQHKAQAEALAYFTAYHWLPRQVIDLDLLNLQRQMIASKM